MEKKKRSPSAEPFGIRRFKVLLEPSSPRDGAL
jgi:hypothetical protein